MEVELGSGNGDFIAGFFPYEKIATLIWNFEAMLSGWLGLPFDAITHTGPVCYFLIFVGLIIFLAAGYRAGRSKGGLWGLSLGGLFLVFLGLIPIAYTHLFGLMICLLVAQVIYKMLLPG